MKIGIWFRESDPLEGGSHTFEAAILSALSLDRPDPDHELLFIGPSGSALDRLSSLGLSTLALPVTGARRWAAKTKLVVGSVPRRLSGRPRTVKTQLDYYIAQARLDFLWCLGPDVPTLDVPYLTTCWDLQHRLQPFFPEVSADGEWDRRERRYGSTLRRAAFVVVGTEAGRNEVQRFYGVAEGRLLTIPHPTPTWVNGVRPNQEVLAKYGLVTPFLLYPAQFWPHKNHVVLLKALRTLADEGSDLSLVLVGADKGNGAYIQTLIDNLDLNKRVHLLGFVENSDLAALYREAFALTYVSLFGPENLPPLEAFSLGTPVIASRVPGADEQLGDAALLFDASDPASLADTIRQLQNTDELRATLVARGKAISQLRSPQRFVERVMEALDHFELVRRSWGPPGW